MSEPEAPSRSRWRTRVGWGVVAAAALAVILSFVLSSDEDAAAREPREAKATPVAVAAVERGAITERRRYPGELDADAADVASFYAGRVQEVHVRVGDLVAARAPVAEIDPVDAREQIARARAQASAAAAEQKRAEVELAAAERDLDRFEGMTDIVSASELDALRARTEALRAAVTTAAARGAEARAGQRLLEKRVVESVVRAPFAGRIAERHVDPGVIVAAGAPLVRVVATAPLRVRFEVPEREVAALSVGTALRIVTEPGTRDLSTGIASRVSGVGAEIDRARRIAIVEAVIDEPPAGWLPGMYAEVVVDLRTIADAVVVPANALLSRLQPDGQTADGVLIADGEVARWTPVTVVAREDDRVAIEPRAGAVAAGAQVLIAGHVDLADGSRIQIATAAEGP